MMNRGCIGDPEASTHAEREMVDLIAGFGREQADAVDQGDPLATLARVAADGVAALNAAMVSGETATEARIALARLQLAFAAGSDLRWVPGERGSSPSGLRLPTAVDAIVAAMSDPGDRSGRAGLAALRLGLIIARCIATLHEASAKPDKSPQAASAWERALKALAGACLDAREQRELPRGLRLMLQTHSASRNRRTPHTGDESWCGRRTPAEHFSTHSFRRSGECPRRPCWRVAAPGRSRERLASAMRRRGSHLPSDPRCADLGRHVSAGASRAWS